MTVLNIGQGYKRDVMKIVFSCDLHGREQLYRDLFAYAFRQEARCVLIGGDLLPTRLGSLGNLLQGRADFSDALQAQFSFIDAFLAPFFAEISERHPGVSLLYVPGNHDWFRAIAYLKEKVPAAICLHARSVSLDGVTFTGYGCTTDSSFWVKDFVRRDLAQSGYVKSRFPLVSTDAGIEVSPEGAYALERPSIEEELSSLSFDNCTGSICIFHCPPFGSGLDTLYTGKPIGSRAIGEFIRKRGPLVSLHGHIHEAPYQSGSYRCAIGSTLAVNPGHRPEKLHAVAFDTDDPGASLTHSVFGAGPVSRTPLSGAMDRIARSAKGLFMKKVLMK